MKGQMNLFPEEYIKDSDCTKDTPVVHGKPDTPIYGMGARIKPRVPGRQDTEHFKSIYLDSLLPLEEYDLIAILLSGGKDSIACYYKLLEMGVPKERIEFWHHDIDGGHPSRRMDWRCTQNYVKAFAEAENVPLRLSWRVNGFFGELYRIGTSEPVEWCEPDTGEIIQCKPSKKYLECKAIKESSIDDMEEKLKEYGCRQKFPAKTADLRTRWCSAYLKIAGIRELYPEDFEALRNDENVLGFTLDNKCNLDEFVGDTESCVYHGDKEAIRSLITGEFTTDDIYVKGDWLYPAGAFHGAEGGSC